MKKYELADLNQLYLDADGAAQALFAEQRSNLLLVSGNHYAKQGSRFWNRVRDNKDLTNEQKIRLTENHIQKVAKIYHNNITKHAPAVTVSPKNKKELSDQKAAELNNSVWQDIVQRKKLREKFSLWVKDFVEIGECWAKIYWEESGGEFKGYQQALDEFGQPMLDEMGQPLADKNQPVFGGDFCFERIFGFNLLLDPAATSKDDIRYAIYRKMVPVKELKEKYKDNEEIQASLTTSQDETYTVFDGATGQYVKQKDHCMWLEYYFKPCAEYPMGYYYMGTKDKIYYEGELPFGIFPIIGTGYEELTTTPRFNSVIRHLRPHQIEVNRCISKIAETQISLGDDKILYQNGAKISQGANFSGIRTYSYSGAEPTIVGGRSGDQYVGYWKEKVASLYQAANIPEEEDEITPQTDPYTLLVMAGRNKARYSRSISKIEQFMQDVCMASLKYAKHYYTDDMLIPAIGKTEYINIPEFRKTEPLSYQIVLEAQTDDAESKLGRQLAINHVLQYVGKNLDPRQIGKMIRLLPYANDEQMFNELTLDYDNAVNDILAMDRGEIRMPRRSDDSKYMVKMFEARMRQPDFEFMSIQIKQIYEQVTQAHYAKIAQEQQQIKAAQSEFIPSGGYLVVVDMYVTSKKDPNKTERARVPYESMKWLLDQLEQQGSSQDALRTMEDAQLAQLSQTFLGGMPPQAAMQGQGQAI